VGVSGTTPRADSLRDITREAVSARIAAVAVDLFAEHGFDHVTVEQIAGTVGISARSFHRYFPSKEDAVIGDPSRLGRTVCRAFAARPRDEPVWASLHASFEAVFAHTGGHDEHAKRIMRVLNSTASLRARSLEKHLMWARLLTPLVAERLDGDHVLLRAQTLVQASLVCLDVALTSWADNDETASISELLKQSFAALNPTT
jgi:AcrR family transcriptional regulator